ncbi:branched-chain amino acid ABC transporter substrate-binding protein [Tenggerimyces flavus]|uniref:Branched-chain amino acid ABC transporter substrate-binding protein n=1 Tax=Tenggerimyces flavus TaxID=1708749 RepID=A0ABV7YIX3_9ACTN|nr:branched-chain amino acid ABC transporter substrate-binding protein [Tenggerimyces flavus]MBM7787556.1 branched-chain amino acid transport system substrate-binding protein [Tenggerimyces flavus]
MRQRSAIRIGLALVAASLALSACGSRGATTDPESDPSSGNPTTQQQKVVKIGVIAPFSGENSAFGLGIRNGADLAIKQANEQNAIPGWKIELAAEDDEGQPDVGKNAATKVAGDDEVGAVVGTFNSGVAQQTAPVLNSANIAQVSPANTNDTLTRGNDFEANPQRLYPNYFRLCATDGIQGPFGAQYLYNDLKITEVATIHDKKTYGQGIVEAFTKEFEKLGGTIVAAETVDAKEKDLGAVISKIQSKNPKAVYYGGEYGQAGPLAAQLESAGLDVPLMGGDGIKSDEFIKLAQDSASGNYGSSVGAPTNELPTASKFVADYEKAGYSEPMEAFGAYSFDSTNAVIKALAVALKDATDVKSARPKVIEALAVTDFEGVTGKVGFDEFGDPVNKVLTMYEVEGGKWVKAKTEAFNK